MHYSDRLHAFGLKSLETRRVKFYLCFAMNVNLGFDDFFSAWRIPLLVAIN